MTKQQNKIMVFGTFDGVHKGHLDFFRQARKLAQNPFLIVSIARDVNVKKIKGDRPLFSEKRRLKDVQSSGLADKVVLGSIKGYMSHIVKEKPDIIALGYDQKAYTENLRSDLQSNGLQIKVVRLKAHKPEKYKSSILKKK